MKDETVHEVDLGIQWDAGSPQPCLLQSELRAALVFYLQVAEPRRNGAGDFAPSAHKSIGVITWDGCTTAILGPPNNEAIQGHRLYERGLREIIYGAGEVSHSRWIARLEKANRVHPRHNPARYESLHHYVLLFHDSTFECLATGYTIQTTTDTMPDVLSRLAHEFVT